MTHYILVSVLTAAISQSADKDEMAISDPASIVTPSASVMNTAQEFTRKVTKDVPSPSDAPSVSDVPIPSLPRVPVPSLPDVPVLTEHKESAV